MGFCLEPLAEEGAWFWMSMATSEPSLAVGMPRNGLLGMPDRVIIYAMQKGLLGRLLRTWSLSARKH